MSTYLLINLLIICFPLMALFYPKIKFYKKLPNILISIILIGIPFILWDSIFTLKQIWAFNPQHLIGIYFLGLPIEEILFFITTPFSCLFVFESINVFLKEKKFIHGKKIIYLIALISLILLILFYSKTYTSIMMTVTILTIILIHLLKPSLFSSLNFFKFTLITFILFLIFNFLLTSIPIVVYNDFQNTGIRILSIPLEDAFYNFSYLTLTLLVYLKSKKLFKN
jgi:lycopene cyclase domain-containing protein